MFITLGGLCLGVNSEVKIGRPEEKHAVRWVQLIQVVYKMSVRASQRINSVSIRKTY
jgi:hypothetical protein